MSPAELPLREDLRGRRPYGAPQLQVAVRLNTNENPFPPSGALVDDLVAALRGVAGSLNRYPDRDAVALRAALAAYLSDTTGAPVGAGSVWAANGSNEVLQQLLQAFGGPGRTALGFTPSYSMHPLIAAATGTGWVAVDRRADFGLDAAAAAAAVREHAPDVVFLTSPNNPTGASLDPGVLAAVCAAAPGMVVLDEAYAEFARAPSAVPLAVGGGLPRLVVTRTMSKAFAMAGTRLGYLAADPAVVDALALVRLPYHLSTLTQAAALTALEHRDELLATVAVVMSERDRVTARLRAAGLTVLDTDANFFLLAAPAGTWQALVERGVLVRDVGLPGWLRVSVGTPAENDVLLAAVLALLSGDDDAHRDPRPDPALGVAR